MKKSFGLLFCVVPYFVMLLIRTGCAVLMSRVFAVELLGRQVPAMNTEEGVRASAGGKPADPQSVRRYLESKFGADLASAREAMEALAGSLEPAELAVKAYPLYEQFRPVVPQGTKGWGKEGELDLDLLASLARSKS